VEITTIETIVRGRKQIKFYETMANPTFIYHSETWTLVKRTGANDIKGIN
jgi:hypothetical protein